MYFPIKTIFRLSCFLVRASVWSFRSFVFFIFYFFSFSLYINDLEKHLTEKGISGLESFSTDIEDDFCIFMKLFIFFYAIDTVILSEIPSDLQHALNEIFCVL